MLVMFLLGRSCLQMFLLLQVNFDISVAYWQRGVGTSPSSCCSGRKRWIRVCSFLMFRTNTPLWGRAGEQLRPNRSETVQMQGLQRGIQIPGIQFCFFFSTNVLRTFSKAEISQILKICPSHFLVIGSMCERDKAPFLRWPWLWSHDLRSIPTLVALLRYYYLWLVASNKQ